MTPVAFYAPMKPPDDPVPSGDRAMGRALMAALEVAGYAPQIASRMRSRDTAGDAKRQQDLIAGAEGEAARLIPLGRGAGWRAWVTYHNYYKAPDLIGPSVARALGLPYLQIEASRARKRLDGPWASFARASEAATDAAAAVLYLTERDAEALHAGRSGTQILAPLPPFLPRPDLPPESSRTGGMLTVAMMRAGDKLASYRLIAEALARLRTPDWRLEIAGDGPARAAVEAMMAPFGQRVACLGALDAEALAAAYARSRLLLWPGVNEAFGMAYLEAQAAGLAVVAQDRPGVREILAPGAFYPPPEAGAAALAERLDMLLAMPKLTLHLGRDARDHIRAHHLIGAAAARLGAVLGEVSA